MHAFALGAMTWQLAVRREASGLSRKCQMLYLAVFAARYLDIFQPGGYLYNFVFKIYYCVTTLALVTLLSAAHPDSCCAARAGWRSHYEWKKDTFVTAFVVIPSLVLGYALTPQASAVGGLSEGASYYYFEEVMWSFSIFLEAFSLLPQYVMMYRLNRAPSRAVVAVIVMLGGYRVLYLVNWALKFSIPGAHFSRFHGVSAAGGLLNLVFYADFLAQQAMGRSVLGSIVKRMDGSANEIASQIGTQLQVLGALAPAEAGAEYDRESAAEHDAKRAKRPLLSPNSPVDNA